MNKKWISKKKAMKLEKQASKEALVRKIGQLTGKGMGELAGRDPSIWDALSLVRAMELEKRK